MNFRAQRAERTRVLAAYRSGAHNGKRFWNCVQFENGVRIINSGPVEREARGAMRRRPGRNQGPFRMYKARCGAAPDTDRMGVLKPCVTHNEFDGGRFYNLG